MKPTEELMQEHDAILEMLDILEQAVERLDAGREVRIDDLQQMLDFLKVFADGCHHAKEEKFLFPALEQAGISRDHGPIGVMLAEHDLGRKYIGGMADAIHMLRLDATHWQHAAAFSKNARAYANLLKAHIQKENRILFPMADMALPEERQQILLQEFTRIESNSSTSHEAIRAVLQDLRTTYLP